MISQKLRLCLTFTTLLSCVPDIGAQTKIYSRNHPKMTAEYRARDMQTVARLTEEQTQQIKALIEKSYALRDSISKLPAEQQSAQRKQAGKIISEGLPKIMTSEQYKAWQQELARRHKEALGGREDVLDVVGVTPSANDTKSTGTASLPEFDEALFAEEMRVSPNASGVAPARLRVDAVFYFEIESPAAQPEEVRGATTLALSDGKASVGKPVIEAPRKLLPGGQSRPDDAEVARRVDLAANKRFKEVRDQPRNSMIATYRLVASARFQPSDGSAFAPEDLRRIKKVTFAFNSRNASHINMGAIGRGTVSVVAELASGRELTLVDTGDASPVWDVPERQSVHDLDVVTGKVEVEFRDLYSHKGWNRLSLPTRR
jgi:hypothetical protein